MNAVAVVYLGYFAALGAFWPYFGPLLLSFGLTPAEATQVIAIGPICGFLAPPVAGLIADALRQRALLVRLLSAGALVATTGFFFAGRSTWLVVATVVVFSICRSPMIALVDASAMSVARAGGPSYGRMRLWGSLGFLCAALLAAELAARGGPRAVLPGMLALMAVAAGAAWFIPPATSTEGGPVLSAWLERLRHPEMWLFVAAAALGTAAHSIYDAGFSLHLERIGHGGRFIGVAWAVGVAGEVGLMAFSARMVARAGADRLFTFALAVAALRWMALSQLTSAAIILVLQPLHGITFGLCWVAGVNVAHDRGSPRAPTAAQGLYAAATAIGAFLGMTFAGKLLSAYGGRGMFLVAAALAALATVSAAGFSRLVRR